MKIFKVEYTMFSALHWNHTDYEITAESKEQLKDAVFKTFEYMADNSEIAKKRKWEEIESKIEETDLKFPIVHQREWTV